MGAGAEGEGQVDPALSMKPDAGAVLITWKAMS